MFFADMSTRRSRALGFQTLSVFIIISMLAVSMPAAPRTVIDVTKQFPETIAELDSPLSSLPTFDSSLPRVDTGRLSAVFTDTLAFAIKLKSLALPSVPDGLENAKLPSLGERTYAFLAPIFTAVKPSAISAAANPVPPQPTSVVDFDFDNDGKRTLAGGIRRTPS